MTIFKVARAAQVALGEGVPPSLLPRYPDWSNPHFYNNGKIQGAKELLYGFLSFALKLQAQRAQTTLVMVEKQVSPTPRYTVSDKTFATG